ncbi:hypothetical protein HanXRQr2_Chr09g0389011 [Helianthus annuus]|uniref:Uncharacterized protein n=1 Tax=Helianthus annuus TaxID=4232 RepID=A0A9K3N8R8_HELAN|nr:hypothetical protein HanXRQr2_Chr09g0389011 [Helianthus annuus]KAJ0893195.1 hypothetical protein HanPSC8_Chr09g0374871 [Helianthus annuus]
MFCKKVKSAILFSMVRTVLSRPRAKNVPELVRTLNEKGVRFWAIQIICG